MFLLFTCAISVHRCDTSSLPSAGLRIRECDIVKEMRGTFLSIGI